MVCTYCDSTEYEEDLIYRNFNLRDRVPTREVLMTRSAECILIDGLVAYDATFTDGLNGCWFKSL